MSEDIKKEFEKAFEFAHPELRNEDEMFYKSALWAARWILEKVYDKWQRGNFSTDELAKMLRELQ